VQGSPPKKVAAELNRAANGRRASTTPSGGKSRMKNRLDIGRGIAALIN
jgi:hypothetical protein